MRTSFRAPKTALAADLSDRNSICLVDPENNASIVMHHHHFDSSLLKQKSGASKGYDLLSPHRIDTVHCSNTFPKAATRHSTVRFDEHVQVYSNLGGTRSNSPSKRVDTRSVGGLTDSQYESGSHSSSRQVPIVVDSPRIDDLEDEVFYEEYRHSLKKASANKSLFNRVPATTLAHSSFSSSDSGIYHSNNTTTACHLGKHTTNHPRTAVSDPNQCI